MQNQIQNFTDCASVTTRSAALANCSGIMSSLASSTIDNRHLSVSSTSCAAAGPWLLDSHGEADPYLQVTQQSHTSEGIFPFQLKYSSTDTFCMTHKYSNLTIKIFRAASLTARNEQCQMWTQHLNDHTSDMWDVIWYTQVTQSVLRPQLQCWYQIQQLQLILCCCEWNIKNVNERMRHLAKWSTTWKWWQVI